MIFASKEICPHFLHFTELGQKKCTGKRNSNGAERERICLFVLYYILHFLVLYTINCSPNLKDSDLKEADEPLMKGHMGRDMG